MEEKSEFKEKLDSQLNDLETQVEKLKLKAKEATEEAKVKYNELIDELEPKIAEGKAKLKELADTADDAWDDVKEGAASIWDQMKVTFNKVADKFDKDDEPKATEEPKTTEEPEA